MTSDANGNGRDLAGPEPLVVVRVKDAVDPSLTGRAGGSYQSPAQPREQAMALVRLLLGREALAAADEARWSCPIAGGHRRVMLRPVTSVLDSIIEDGGTNDV